MLPGHLKPGQPLVHALALIRALRYRTCWSVIGGERCRCWPVIGRDSLHVLVNHVIDYVVAHLVAPSNDNNNNKKSQSNLGRAASPTITQRITMRQSPH